MHSSCLRSQFIGRDVKDGAFRGELLIVTPINQSSPIVEYIFEIAPRTNGSSLILCKATIRCECCTKVTHILTREANGRLLEVAALVSDNNSVAMLCFQRLPAENNGFKPAVSLSLRTDCVMAAGAKVESILPFRTTYFLFLGQTQGAGKRMDSTIEPLALGRRLSITIEGINV